MIDFEKDYYATLEINSQAKPEDIKLAYRRLVKLYHPDLHPGEGSYEEKIKLINEAYEILSHIESRAIYDEYILSRESYREKLKGNSKNRRSILKTRKVTKEYRYYLKGEVIIKYWGDADDQGSYDALRDVSYKLHIRSIQVKVDAKNIHQENDLPHSYQQVFDSKRPISLLIPNPVQCEVIDQNNTHFVKLNLESVTLPNPVIENSTKFENQVFGTLVGEVYAYFKEVKDYEETYEVEECSGETGAVEEKIVEGVPYQRKQYYHADCSTYWGEWVSQLPRKTHIPTGKDQRKGDNIKYEYFYSNYKDTYWGPWQYRNIRKPVYASRYGNIGCLPRLGLGGLITWILLFHLSLWPIALIILAFYLINRFVPSARIEKGFSILFYVGYFSIWLWLIFISFRDHSKTNDSAKQNITPSPEVQNDTHQSPRKLKNPIPQTDAKDPYYRQYVHWRDYHQENYQGSFRLKKLDILAASDYRNSIDLNQQDGQPYDQLIAKLSEESKPGLSELYQMFDSIQVVHQFNERQFAECIVSYVQCIPYTLILPLHCDARLYNDQFITDYLRKPGARCEGPVKYGIYSPVEFMATMEGDCDTRTVLLFTLLSHYQYDVAVLSSEYYGHSILGINLNYSGISYADQGKRYVLWETTAGLVEPGILPNEVSNLNYWRISLKSKPYDRY